MPPRRDRVDSRVADAAALHVRHGHRVVVDAVVGQIVRLRELPEHLLAVDRSGELVGLPVDHHHGDERPRHAGALVGQDALPVRVGPALPRHRLRFVAREPLDVLLAGVHAHRGEHIRVAGAQDRRHGPAGREPRRVDAAPVDLHLLGDVVDERDQDRGLAVAPELVLGREPAPAEVLVVAGDFLGIQDQEALAIGQRVPPRASREPPRAPAAPVQGQHERQGSPLLAGRHVQGVREVAEGALDPATGPSSPVAVQAPRHRGDDRDGDDQQHDVQADAFHARSIGEHAPLAKDTSAAGR